MGLIGHMRIHDGEVHRDASTSCAPSNTSHMSPMSSTTSTSSRAPQTQHLTTYLVLIFIAYAHHASGWSVACASIAQRPVNQFQKHHHTPAPPSSTVCTAHAHSRTTWVYKATCISMDTCGRTQPAIPQHYISPHQPMQLTQSRKPTRKTFSQYA
ncbi:unnamed protein product [Schistocephalus solidus]|uniref:Secreted protein n=1 Tax=Schistocephalus solidus TaxID=70667 RepID=A0A183S8V1_SCHSO|nr:unnamed protein product [Schistocephalus solidus]